MRESRWVKALFIGPAFIFFAFFLLLPVVASLGLAFTSWTGFDISQIMFIGGKNFVTAAHDPILGKALWHTAAFVVVTTVLVNIVGLGFALLINTRVRGHDVLRVAVFLPLAVSPVLTAVLWQFILGPNGFINDVLVDGLHITDSPVEFLGNVNLAFWTLVTAAVWQSSGLNMLLFYAGLQSLPPERMEAGALDGAKYWSRVRWIVLPHLRPMIAIAVVLNLIGGWKVFDLVLVLTDGGPERSTEVLSTYLYQQAFEFNDMGFSAVLALIIVVLAVVSTLVRRPISGPNYS